MRLVLAATAAASLVLCGAALAAPVTVSYDPAVGATLTGTPGPDHVFVLLDGTPEAPIVSVESLPDGAAAGPGCTIVETVGRCPVPAGGKLALSASLGEGDDTLEVWGLDTTADLGPGDDRLRESTSRTVADLGPGNDSGGLGDAGGSLAGGEGDDVLGGGSSDDAIDGGPGRDWLFGTPGADQLVGGPDVDRVDYTGLMTATGPLPTVEVLLASSTTSKNGGKAPGAAGTDALVELEGAVGTPRADVLVGGPLAEVLDGGAGDDLIRSREGVPDELACGAGVDDLDIDLKDRVRDAPTCERSARGAIDELPNVEILAGRPVVRGTALDVTLRCPTGAGALGCPGTLVADRAGERGARTRYRLAAGKRGVVRVALPAGVGAITVTSVERGRSGVRTTIRVLGQPAAPARTAQGEDQADFLPAIGEQEVGAIHQTSLCERPDEYVVGFRVRTVDPSLFVFGLGSIGDPGIRAIQPLCGQMQVDGGLSLGALTAPVLGEFLGGGTPFGFKSYETIAQCEMPVLDGFRRGVAHGLFADLTEREDPRRLAAFGFECAFADDLDPILFDISNTSLDRDETRTCPPGTAVKGLRVGGTGRTPDFISIAVVCRAYPLQAATPSSLGPRGGETVALTNDARFTWRKPGAVSRVCITSAIPSRCVRTTQSSIPLRDLLSASDVGSRITWSVRACNAIAEGEAPDRACGPTAREPGLGSPISFGVRISPELPVVVSASRPRAPGANRRLSVSTTFRGGRFAAAHTLTLEAGIDAVAQQRLPEDPLDWGTSRSASIAGTIPAGRQVVRVVVRSCAGDPTLPSSQARAEVCSLPVVATRLLLDAAGRLCTVPADPVPQSCPAPRVAGRPGL